MSLLERALGVAYAALNSGSKEFEAPEGMEEFQFFSKHFPAEEADGLFARLQSDVPWERKRWLGEKLPQLAHVYDNKNRGKKGKAIVVLDELMNRVESEFGCTVHGAWCNLFENGSHHIDWHQDNYGEHVFVLSFGTSRRLEWRNLKSREETFNICSHGDLYYFAPTWDKKHKHRVPKDPSSTDPRVSLVFTSSQPTTGKKQ